MCASSKSTHWTRSQIRIEIRRSTNEWKLIQTFVFTIGTICDRNFFNVRHRQLQLLSWMPFEHITTTRTFTFWAACCFDKKILLNIYNEIRESKTTHMRDKLPWKIHCSVQALTCQVHLVVAIHVSNDTLILHTQHCHCTMQFGCPVENQNWHKHRPNYWSTFDLEGINLGIFPVHETVALCHVLFRHRILLIADLAIVRIIFVLLRCYMLLDLIFLFDLFWAFDILTILSSTKFTIKYNCSTHHKLQQFLLK